MRQHSDSPPEDVSEALQQARNTLAGIEPILPRVNQRIAQTTMKPPHMIRLASIALAVLLLGSAAIFFSHHRARSAVEVVQSNSNSNAAFSFGIDDVQITAHVAAVMDRRAVLVVWSSPDSTKNDAADASAPLRIGKYRRYFLRSATLSDGQRATFCLFIADEGVSPVLEPPMVISDLGRGRAIQFSVSPQSITDRELPQTLCSAGLADGAAIATDVDREIQKHLNE